MIRRIRFWLRLLLAATWRPPEGVGYQVTADPAEDRVAVLMRACCALHTGVLNPTAPLRRLPKALDAMAAEAIAARDRQHAAKEAGHVFDLTRAGRDQ